MFNFATYVQLISGVGSCIIKYVDERFTLYIVGWRGTSSLRAYVDSNETLHILRLLGADLSKFGKWFYIIYDLFFLKNNPFF